MDARSTDGEKLDGMHWGQTSDLDYHPLRVDDEGSHVEAVPTDQSVQASDIEGDASLNEDVAAFDQKTGSFFKEGLARKTSARFSRETVKVLKGWLLEHAEHPYPGEEAMNELKDRTGLQRIQISNWLANARRRQKARLSDSFSHSRALDIPRADEQSHAHLGPMDRWRASPPEHEPASLSDIARAVTNQPMPSPSHDVPSMLSSDPTAGLHGVPNGGCANWTSFRAPSESSFDSRASSHSSLSRTSSKSLNSTRPSLSSHDRRRRRKVLKTTRTRNSENEKRFQCTFCTASFATKYDWQRHEKSLHLALERWVCCPDGGAIDIDGVQRCAFCPQVYPSAHHLEDHNYEVCKERTIQERTFYRKDHLRQHLKQTHNCVFDPIMNSWKSVLVEISSRCGFCPSTFTTWQQRVDHLAAHFLQATAMSSWSGGWGFDPDVEACVQNAIPPYVIGHEKFSMNPYIVHPHSESVDKTSQGDYDALPKSDQLKASVWDNELDWVGQTRESLITFMSAQKAAGIVPTDRQLQDHARLAIYGDLDPLDYTIADHEVWLNDFKQDVGFDFFFDGNGLDFTETIPPAALHVTRNETDLVQKSTAPLINSPSTTLPNLTPAVEDLEHGLFSTDTLDFDVLDFNTCDFNGLEVDGIEDSASGNEIQDETGQTNLPSQHILDFKSTGI